MANNNAAVFRDNQIIRDVNFSQILARPKTIRIHGKNAIAFACAPTSNTKLKLKNSK